MRIQPTVDAVEALCARNQTLSDEESIAVAEAIGDIALQEGTERLAAAAGAAFSQMPVGVIGEAWNVMVNRLVTSPQREELLKLIHPRVVYHAVTREFGVPVGKAGLHCTPQIPPIYAEISQLRAGKPAGDPALRLRAVAIDAAVREARERLRRADQR